MICNGCGEEFTDFEFSRHLTNKGKRHVFDGWNIGSFNGVYVREISRGGDILFYIGETRNLLNRYVGRLLQEVIYFEEWGDKKVSGSGTLFRKLREAQLVVDFVEAGLPLANKSVEVYFDVLSETNGVYIE